MRTAFKILVWVFLGIIFVGLPLFIVFIIWSWTSAPREPEFVRIGRMGSASELQWTSEGSQIVFSYAWRVFVADSEGSSVRKVHDSSDRDDLHLSASISPDESQIAYLKYKHHGFFGESLDWKIATSAPDGSGERIIADPDVAPDAGYTYIVWSPDGSRVGYLSSDAIHTMAPDGSDRRTVVDIGELLSDYRHVKWGSTPTWSPDWERVAFSAYFADEDNNGRRVTYTIGIDGNGLTKIADDATGPAWSPDGSRLAFFKYTQGHDGRFTDFVRLRTVRTDGSDPREIASFRMEPWDLAFSSISWSPDGNEILLGHRVIGVDGSGVRTLPRPPNRIIRSVWSPDGSRVGIRTTQGRGSHLHYILYTVARDGSDGRVLATVDSNGWPRAMNGRPLEDVIER